jgi:chromosome segregation ATPase
MKPALVALVFACLALTAGLIVVHQKADARVQALQAESTRINTEFDGIKTKFTDLEKLYVVQQDTLKARDEELTSASNNLAKATGDLAKASGDLAKSAEEIKALQAEMAKRQERITTLENERDGLTKKMDELNSSIDGLENQIADTKRKLATSEGDKTFLLGELKRLQTQRDDLLKQFNNIAALRVQVAKLRDEAAIKQRLEWKRLGVYSIQDQKGAERLLARNFSVPTVQSRLDAELHQDGAAHSASTNGVPAAVTPQ